MNEKLFFWDSHLLEIWGGTTWMGDLKFRVHGHTSSIGSGVWPDFQPMRVREEPVCILLFQQNPVFTTLHFKSPIHVVPPQGGKNWILPQEINANRYFWDFHWLEIWKNHSCHSMGPNGRSVVMDSGETTYVPPFILMASMVPHGRTYVVFIDLQAMRVSEEPVCIYLFLQNPFFTSLQMRSPGHVILTLMISDARQSKLDFS